MPLNNPCVNLHGHLVLAVLGVEMGWPVIVIQHVYDNPQEPSDFGHVPTPPLQPHDAVAAIDVEHFAGHAAGKVAQQVEGRGAQFLEFDVAAQARFSGGVLAHLIETRRRRPN